MTLARLARLTPMAGNTSAIVAIELLAAAQGIEFRAPLKTSPRLAAWAKEKAQAWGIEG